MSKPESRRLKNLYNKHSSTSYASKLRKLLGRKDEVSKDEFLLGEEMISAKGSIKVPRPGFQRDDARRGEVAATQGRHHSRAVPRR